MLHDYDEKRIFIKLYTYEKKLHYLASLLVHQYCFAHVGVGTFALTETLDVMEKIAKNQALNNQKIM